MEETERDAMAKCNMGSWTGSLIRKRTFVKTGEIEVYSVDAVAPMLALQV